MYIRAASYCTLADKKMADFSSESKKRSIFGTDPRSAEAVGIAVCPPCCLESQNNGVDTHTQRPSTITLYSL